MGSFKPSQALNSEGNISHGTLPWSKVVRIQFSPQALPPNATPRDLGMTTVQQTEAWLGRVAFSKQCRKVIHKKILWIRWTPWVITHLGHITIVSSKIASNVRVWAFVKIDDKTLSHKTLFCIYKTFNKSQISFAWVRGMFLTYKESEGPAKHLYSSVQTSHVWVKACTLRGIVMLIMQFLYIKHYHALLIGLFLGFSKLTLLVLARMEGSTLRVWLYFWFLSDQSPDTSELFFVTPSLLGLWYQQLFFVFVFVFYHFYSCFGFIREDERIEDIKCEVEVIQINITECLPYDRH